MLGLASEIPSDSVRCIDDGSSSTIAGALSRILHANSSTSSSATTATTTSRYEHSTGNCGLVSSSMVMTLQSLGPSSGSTDSLEDVMMCSSVAGPRTPDASEKDTDGESEDMTVEREVVGVEAMESAVQLLLLLMGESPSRPVRGIHFLYYKRCLRNCVTSGCSPHLSQTWTEQVTGTGILQGMSVLSCAATTS